MRHPKRWNPGEGQEQLNMADALWAIAGELRGIREELEED